MAASSSAARSVSIGQQVPGGFAKLQGQNFEYFVQKYSVTLGRNAEGSTVDFDLSNYDNGGRGQHVPPFHARIFYDFEQRHFALDVLGRNGCTIQGFSYLPGSAPVKLNSQDLIEIDGVRFYFLLPSRSICVTPAARDTSSLHPSANDGGHCNGDESGIKISTGIIRRLPAVELDTSDCYGPYGINADPVGTLDGSVDNIEMQSADKDTLNQQMLLEEEKDVVICLATLICHLSGPEKWVPMEKFHSEIFERFVKNYPDARISRYLKQKSESGSSTGAKGRPWCGLLPLLRKYPEHFVMCTVTRGQITIEYIGLVHLVSVENKP